jgi:hypothetical protein
MSIYKQLNRNNITTTARVVRKQFNLHSGSLGINAIQFVSNSTDSNLSSSYWNSLRVGFYLSASSGETSLNDPTITYGLYDKNNPQHLNKFNASGSLLSIDQSFIGEGIEPKTFYIFDNSTNNEIKIRDDGYGNLYSTNASVSKSGASSISSSDNYVGNIFYQWGLAIITETGSWSPSVSYKTVGTSNYNVKYKSIQTIHSTEWSLPVNPAEFNITNNPTAYKKDIRNTSASIVTSQYRDDNITGSSWSPYITTLGLYDKYNNLIVVGRLSQPIKKRKDTRIIFKIKKDW